MASSTILLRSRVGIIQLIFIYLNLTDLAGDMLQGKRRETGYWVLDAGYWIKDKEEVRGRRGYLSLDKPGQAF
jgi:hypothetical protein